MRGFVTAAVRGRVETPDQRLAMLLVVGTVPTGVVGVFFQKQFQGLFANPGAAASFLVVNGILLLGAELLRRRAERRAQREGRGRVAQEEAFTDVSRLSYRAAGLVGLCQVLALFPGLSRSGVTMGGGLLARSAPPGGGTLLLPSGHADHRRGWGARGARASPPKRPLASYLLGAVLAGLAAYGSARFLIRYFRSGRLDPYAWYCAAVGIGALLLLR